MIKATNEVQKKKEKQIMMKITYLVYIKNLTLFYMKNMVAKNKKSKGNIF